MDTFEKCIRKLGSQISDSEKIAVLMVLSKILPKLPMDKKMAKRMFNSIGDKFILKLLKLPNSSENNITFQHVGILILTSIAKYDVDVMSENDELIVALFDVINRPVGTVNETIISEILELLKVITSNKSVPKVLSNENNLILKLSNVLVVEELADVAVDVAVNISRHNKTSDKWLELLLNLSEKYVQTEEIEKFYILDTINKLLEKFLTVNLKENNEESNYEKKILQNLNNSNLNILSSKCRPKYKKKVLLMASLILKLFAGSKTLFPCEKPSRFILTLLTCVSVELAISLDDYDNKNEDDNSEILASLEITHFFIGYIACESFHASGLASDNDFLIKVFSCFKNIMASLYQFVRRAHLKSCLDNPIFHKCIIVICVWATEETSSLQEELKLVFPIVLSCMKHQLESAKKSDADKDIMNFAIPCLSQIIADDHLSPVLLSNKMTKIVTTYFKHLIDNSNINSKLTVTFKESLVNLLLQTILLFPKQSHDMRRMLDINNLSGHVISEMHNTTETFYRFELAAFYFGLLKNVQPNSSPVDNNKIILEELLGNSFKVSMEEGERNMWCIALQNITECIKNGTVVLDNGSSLVSLLNLRMKEIGDGNKSLLESLNKSLVIP